jgi:hypothetical protein
MRNVAAQGDREKEAKEIRMSLGLDRTCC